jgi:hypothetical protein
MAGALTAFFPSAAGRMVYPLNQGWLWSREIPPGAQERDFQDSASLQRSHSALPTALCPQPLDGWLRADARISLDYERSYLDTI